MQHIIKVLMINTERKDQAFESVVEDVMKIGRHCASLSLLDAEFFLASPLRTSDLKVKRIKDNPREPDL
jgi:hypothetical protein